MVDQWNKSLTMKVLRVGAHILYKLTGNKRFLAGSVLKFMNMQVNILILFYDLSIDSLNRPERFVRSKLLLAISFAGHHEVKVGS